MNGEHQEQTMGVPPVLETAHLGGELIVPDVTGDERIQWNKDDKDQVKRAKERFDEMKAKRFTAYRTDKKGNQAEVIHDFDPNAERITFIGPMIGG